MEMMKITYENQARILKLEKRFYQRSLTSKLRAVILDWNKIVVIFEYISSNIFRDFSIFSPWEEVSTQLGASNASRRGTFLLIFWDIFILGYLNNGTPSQVLWMILWMILNTPRGFPTCQGTIGSSNHWDNRDNRDWEALKTSIVLWHRTRSIEWLFTAIEWSLTPPVASLPAEEQ